MDIKYFAEKLKLLAPPKESLKKFGVEDSFIDYFISRFYCIPKLDRNIKIYSNDTILQLLQYYDCSKIEIGAVTFLFEPIEDVSYYQIGNVDADVLILDKMSLKVKVLDYTNVSHVIWECSSSSDNFLEALLLCAEFFTLRLQDSSLAENNKYITGVINNCTEKAGGNEYTSFYKVLLDID